MLKELEFRWKQRRLSRQYHRLMERELNARRREEIWWEYSDEYNELLTERKLYQDSMLLSTAVRMRLPVPVICDSAGALTRAWRRDYAGRLLMTEKAFCELRQEIRRKRRLYRFDFFQWVNFLKFLVVTAALILEPPVSYGLTVDEWLETQDKAETDKIEISVRYDKDKCRVNVEMKGNAIQYLEVLEKAERKTLLVSIHNRSKHTSAKVKWSLAVRRKGHSDDLTDYHELPPNQQLEFKRSNAFANDKILLPGESDEQCYDLPHMSGGYSPADLVYSVKSKSVDFIK